MAYDYNAEQIVALEGSKRGSKGTFVSVPGLTKSKLNLLKTFWLKRELELFSRMYDVKRLQTRELVKTISEWNKLVSKNPRLLLSEKQHDIILGTLLGDANIRNRGKDCQFRTSHSDKQSLYLYWLEEVLEEFTNNRFNIYERKNRLPEIYFETLVHPVFNYYFNLFYVNGRKQVSEEILSQLTPQAVAVWLCDDGSYGKKGKQIVLCTNSFTLKEHNLMKTYFEEKWEISPTIGFRDKKYYYLRFTKDDTRKLISIVKEFIPKCMKYKIGETNA